MSLDGQIQSLVSRLATEVNSVRSQVPALVSAGTLSGLTVQQVATPATPAAGLMRIYAKSDGLIYSKDEAGVERQITATALAQNGIRQLTSFAGANDTARTQAAIDFAASEDAAGRYIPWFQLPADRAWNTGSSSFGLASGLKFLGGGFPIGPNNIQIDEQLVNGKWLTTCGSGASSLWSSTSQMYGIKFVGIVFHGSSTSQIFRSTSNVYAAQFDNLFFYGCKHAFGSPSEKFLMTQVIFSGHWGFSGCVDTVFTLGGSDNTLWMGGAFANIDLAQNGGGAPLGIFNGMSKTDVGKMYVTNRNDWVGVRIIGNQSNDLAFFGGEYEGVSAASPSNYPIFDIQGGSNTFYSIKTGQVASGASANGVIHQSGGQATFYAPAYRRGSATPASFPYVYQTGGTCKINDPVVLTAGEQMRVRTSDGQTLTLAAHRNDFVTSEIEAYTFSVTGTVPATQTGKSRVYMEGSYVVESVRAAVGTVPTTALVVDVNKNGTTIYTTQGNRPSIAIGANSATGGTPDVLSFAAGDYLTVDVDAGAGAADLAVTVRMRRVG